MNPASWPGWFLQPPLQNFALKNREKERLMTHEKRARELAFLCFCASASRLCQNEERRASERGMHDNDNPTRAKQERGHVHMMSAQEGGKGSSKSRCCKEADAGKKLCKGGCVKMKTREGGDQKMLQTSHIYGPKSNRPSLSHSLCISIAADHRPSSGTRDGAN